MESKLQWEGPFKKQQTLSEYFVARTSLGEIQIRFCNTTNLSTEALMSGNPGQNHKVFNVAIMYEKFPENNLTFSENLLVDCFTIVDQWYENHYNYLRNIFNSNPLANAAQLIHVVFLNKFVNECKNNSNKKPIEIPKAMEYSKLIDTLEEIFPDLKYKE